MNEIVAISIKLVKIWTRALYTDVTLKTYVMRYAQLNIISKSPEEATPKHYEMNRIKICH